MLATLPSPQAAAHQPVSVAIEADQKAFQLYMGGVFSDETCGIELDHGVLVVGYGVDAEEGEYYIVKNSWGPEWGDKVGAQPDCCFTWHALVLSLQVFQTWYASACPYHHGWTCCRPGLILAVDAAYPYPSRATSR